MTIREEVQAEEYKRAYAEGYRQGFRDGLLGGYDMHIYATADRKTEPTGYNLSAVEDEPLTCDGNCWMKKQNGEWLCEHCQREPKDEPQTFDKPSKCLGCLYSDLDKAFHPCASCVDFDKYVGEVSGKDEPQTCEECEHWSDTEDGCADRHGCKDKPQTDYGDFADRLAYERGVEHAWEVAQKVFNSTVTFYEAEDVAKQIAKIEPTISKMEQVEDEP